MSGFRGNIAWHRRNGLGDPEILEALVLIGEPDANPVIEATRRIGRLVEIVEGISAAAVLDRRAQKAAIEVAEVGKLTVREGNPGDDAINDWIAAMMPLYRKITGKEPATSVGAPSRSNEGIEDAWRSRVRTILKGASGQN